MNTESAELFRRAERDEIVLAEHVRQIWAHVPRASVQRADLLVPAYWSQATKLVRTGDRIECTPADAAWFDELLVRSVGGEGVVVVRLRGGMFEDVATPPGIEPVSTIEAEFEYMGPLRKWAVVAKGGHVMKSGLETREEAAGWLQQHRRTAKT
jgi:hypothetical protein